MKLRVGICFIALALAATPVLAQNYDAILDGPQAGTISPATGTATMNLDGAKMLHFSISYSGLIGTETAAHFHGPAMPGFDAGVTFGLPSGNPKNGSVGPLSAAQEADLNAGLWYINIHTTFDTSGEIRGQVYPESVAIKSATWSRIKSLLR